MKRDPRDPEGEFDRRNYRLNHPEEDVFCAREYVYGPVPHLPTLIRKRGNEVPTITDKVHEVIRQREKIGMATYHRPLLAGDGRDTLQDAIEEAADLLQYLVKLKVEREG